LSVFDLMDQAGLGDLVVSQAAAGGAAQGGNQAANNNNNNNNANSGNGNANNANDNANDNQQAADQGNAAAGGNAAVDCNAGQGNTANNATDNANNNQNANNNNDNQQDAAAGNDTAAAGGQAAAGTVAGADFGKCTPTITFQGGEGNRPATEFTFQIADPVARGGQGEALNPNIITNALCNQLTNVCDANDAAKAACADAKAQVAAAGTRDKSTADLFNSALGFAGAVTNPAGGPENPPAAAAAAGAARRRMRRGLRL
jgi:hypothetical protein